MSQHHWYRHAIPFALAAGLLVPAIAAAQGIAEPHAPITSTLGEIGKARAEYVDAFNAKDSKGVNAMFTTDAVFVGSNGSSLVGWSAIAKSNSESSASWPHVVINSESTKVYGTTAVDVGTWTQHPAAGGEMNFRYVAVLRHGIHGWKMQNVAVVPITQ
jgi:ketosteroid isomerase-like protein